MQERPSLPGNSNQSLAMMIASRGAGVSRRGVSTTWVSCVSGSPEVRCCMSTRFFSAPVPHRMRRWATTMCAGQVKKGTPRDSLHGGYSAQRNLEKFSSFVLACGIPNKRTEGRTQLRPHQGTIFSEGPGVMSRSDSTWRIRGATMQTKNDKY